jgi:chondroitin 4-sulfotransferase 11
MLHRIRPYLSDSLRLKKLFIYCLQMLPIHTAYSINRELRTPYSKIEQENNIIFIHIPKAAGNAIVKSLFDAPATGHDPIIRYIKNDYEKFKSFYRFTVVRNPWDRMVSSFHYLKQGGIGFFDKDFRDRFMFDIDTFDSFVKKMMINKAYEIKILTWVHFIPQHSFLENAEGDICVEKVYKLENISHEFHHLCNDLGLVNKTLLVENRSERQRYQQYYTAETADYVAEIYSDDIRRFNYTFD